MKQPRWNKYESAILLEGYLEILSQKASRKMVQKRVSSDLRHMATNRGIVIDEIYRNESGISFQLSLWLFIQFAVISLGPVSPIDKI